MAQRSNVIIDVELQDGATRGLARLRGQIAQVEQSTRRAGDSWGDFAKRVSAATAISHGTLSVIRGIETAASAAAGSLTGLFNRAAETQTETIGVVNQIRALSGVSYAEAEKIFASTELALNKAAATLPGETADYITAARGVADNAAKLFDVSTKEGQKKFQEALKDVGIIGGIMKGTTNLTDAQISRGLNNFLAGKSKASIESQVFGREGISLLTEIEKYYESIGTSWKSATEEQRLAALQSAKQALYTSEIVSKYTNSIQGQIAGFRDALTNDLVGVFGTRMELGDGLGTLAESFGVLTKSLIGSEGLFRRFGAALAKVGIDETTFQRTFRNINLALAKIADSVSFEWVEQVAAAFESSRSLGQAVANGVVGMVRRLASAINGALSFGVDGAASSGVGRAIGGFFAGIFDVLSRIDWAAAMGNLGTMLGQLSLQLSIGLSRIPWMELGFFAGSAVVTGIRGLMSLLVNWITQGGWTTGYVVVQSAVSALLGLAAGLITSVGQALGALASWLVSAGVNAVVSAGQLFVQGVARFFQDIGAFVQGAIGQVTSTISGVVGRIQSAISSIRIPFFGGGSNGGTAGAPVTSRFLGSPNLFGAIANELRRKPTGSGLQIANSSELVATPGQIGNLLRSVAGGNGGGTFAPSIVVNAGSTSDPQAIAQIVLSTLERQYRKSRGAFA